MSLNGRVVNGTHGGGTTEGLTVLLLVNDGAGGLVSTGQATTGVRGDFEITDVPVVPGASYLLDVDFQGTAYQKAFTEEQRQEELQLTVYETTGDLSAIRLKRHVMVITGIEAQKREITAIEFVRVANTGDRTVSPDLSGGPPMGFLRFSLPPGTRDLRVNSDLPSREIISVGSGFAVTSPISPGDHSIEFSYRFPYQSSKLSYRQNLLQGAESYQVMTPEYLSQLQVSPLAYLESVDIQGTGYNVWQASDLEPGDGFLLELANLPSPSLVAQLRSASGSTAFWIMGIPALMAAALAGLMLFGILTKPPQAAPADSRPLPTTLDPVARAGIIQELARLDQRYEAGEIPEEEYLSQRQRLKDQILGTPDGP